ncbi:MAG: ribulokinase, partial [Blastopirellula sp. JB062]
ITGCRIVLSKEPESVLLGSAMLGAVAAQAFPSLLDAMSAMSGADQVIPPSDGTTSQYHQAKYDLFLRMHDDQLAYRDRMSRIRLDT